jgi:hypothetical protein
VPGLTGAAAGFGAGHVAVARWTGEPVTAARSWGWMASEAFGGARKAVRKAVGVGLAELVAGRTD